MLCGSKVRLRGLATSRRKWDAVFGLGLLIAITILPTKAASRSIYVARARHDDSIVLPPVRPRREEDSYEDPTVRLSGGRVRGEGNIEVLYEGEWGAVCDDSWGTADATVVCRELGFAGHPDFTVTDAFQTAAFADADFKFQLDDAECNGSEPHLTSCAGKWGRKGNCGRPYEWAGVKCEAHNCLPGYVGSACCPVRSADQPAYNELSEFCCDRGFAGQDCSLESSKYCAGHGEVNDDGGCECDLGWAGANCGVDLLKENAAAATTDDPSGTLAALSNGGGGGGVSGEGSSNSGATNVPLMEGSNRVMTTTMLSPDDAMELKETHTMEASVLEPVDEKHAARDITLKVAAGLSALIIVVGLSAAVMLGVRHWRHKRRVKQAVSSSNSVSGRGLSPARVRMGQAEAFQMHLAKQRTPRTSSVAGGGDSYSGSDTVDSDSDAADYSRSYGRSGRGAAISKRRHPSGGGGNTSSNTGGDSGGEEDFPGSGAPRRTFAETAFLFKDYKTAASAFEARDGGGPDAALAARHNQMGVASTHSPPSTTTPGIPAPPKSPRASRAALPGGFGMSWGAMDEARSLMAPKRQMKTSDPFIHDPEMRRLHANEVASIELEAEVAEQRQQNAREVSRRVSTVSLQAKMAKRKSPGKSLSNSELPDMLLSPTRKFAPGSHADESSLA